jgi:hypothetical protein
MTATSISVMPDGEFVIVPGFARGSTASSLVMPSWRSQAGRPIVGQWISIVGFVVDGDPARIPRAPDPETPSGLLPSRMSIASRADSRRNRRRSHPHRRDAPRRVEQQLDPFAAGLPPMIHQIAVSVE